MSPILLAVEIVSSYTLHVYSVGRGKGPTLHVHTDVGEKGYALQVHSAGCGIGYTLHVHTAVLVLVVVKGMPCARPKLQVVESDTPCTSIDSC
jgi:hypothetical protein